MNKKTDKTIKLIIQIICMFMIFCAFGCLIIKIISTSDTAQNEAQTVENIKEQETTAPLTIQEYENLIEKRSNLFKLFNTVDNIWVAGQEIADTIKLNTSYNNVIKQAGLTDLISSFVDDCTLPPLERTVVTLSNEKLEIANLYLLNFSTDETSYKNCTVYGVSQSIGVPTDKLIYFTHGIHVGQEMSLIELEQILGDYTKTDANTYIWFIDPYVEYHNYISQPPYVSLAVTIDNNIIVEIELLNLY